MVRLVFSLLVLGLTLRASPLEGLDAWVEARLKEWHVPGLALGIVQDDKVIHLRAYGLRDVENKLPVTTRTVFGIGSITKSFTALALATLVEEGKLDWDTPVRDYFPEFRLHDPIATQMATPRDLLAHRTGLPRHDSMWVTTPFSRAELFARLRHLPPSKDFRAAFQYNNLMYMAAGMLAERVSGLTWEELVRRRLLEPLGMRGAGFSVRDFEKLDDWARNYAESESEIPPTPGEARLRLIPPRNLDAIGPAGSINASIEEMVLYLRFHLGDGKLDGRQIIPARSLATLRTPHMLLAPGAFGPASLGPTAYGLGLALARYRDHPLVFHTGTIGGYHALLAYLPDDRIGVVILQNRVLRPVSQLISWQIYDRLLGLPPIDWNTRFLEEERAARVKAVEARRADEARRRPGTHPSHPLADYTGLYRHPAYGDCRVELSAAGELSAACPGRKFPLRHYHYDVFQSGPLRFRFVTATDGEISQMTSRLEPAVAEIVFERAAEPAAAARRAN